MTESASGSRNRRAAGLRFGSKLLILLLGLVLSVQLATLLAVNLAVENAIDAQLHRELDVAQRVWEESHASRLRQLVDRVAVLADDFGFKEAVASADPPTVESALGNAGSRIGAPYALLLSPKGDVSAALLPGAETPSASVLQGLLVEAHDQGFVAGVAALGDAATAFALVPVFAPDLVAWVGLGVPFGEQALFDFAAITGLDAALVLGSDCRIAAALGDFRAWSLDAGLCAGLQRLRQQQEFRFEGDGGPEPMLALRLSRPAAEPAFLLIKSSREKALTPFRSLTQQALGLAAIATALALVVAVGVGRRVSRPLARVSAAAARIVEGDYGQPLQVRGSDELAELADAFNRMQDGIARRERQIVFQAGHDALTGLPNRDWALTALAKRLDAAREAPLPGAVLLVDIRGFRQINDLLGHSFGDQVLIKAAERLSSAVRADDVVARLGGNEFMVLLQKVDAEQARSRAEHLASTLQRPLGLGETAIQLNVNIGLVEYPQADGDATSLVRRADIALNEAKAANVLVTSYTPGHDELHLRQLRLIGDLRRAIDEEQLSLVYQPKVDIRTGQVTHGEALLRWQHPELGRIAPDEFIPLAERSGLIRAISARVIEQGLAQVARWREAGVRSGVAINLSALDLGDSQVVDRVASALERYKVSPVQLILEVTESAVMQDLNAGLICLQRLKRLGVRIAIDDFGTGQSSLAQLKRLPVDELKIDKSFVLDLQPDSEDEQIVHSIVELAHALSLKVVAEGVETELGLALLRKHGCETAQGYFFSRPLSAEDYSVWCQARQSEQVA